MLKVVEIMTRYVDFLAADATARDAAVMMGELDVGAVPVGSAERLEGVVTDRDVLYRVVASGLDPNAVRVAEIMSRPVVSCTEEDTVRTALELMASHHIRRMPVLDTRGHVAGWVTLADLSRKLLVDSARLQGALSAMDELA